jgi:hypothetical protein
MPSMTEEPAFFVREGDRFVPTGQGASPWTRTTQGGIPLAGLIAHNIENIPAPSKMNPARLTIDIIGAVPMRPLFCISRIIREGRRVQLIDMELQAEGRTWVRASVLRVRSEATPSMNLPLSHSFPDEPEKVIRKVSWSESIPVKSDFLVPGPGTIWVKFQCQVVEGQAITPLERIAMASDFGSGIAPLFSSKEWTFANLDISIHLSRLPQGEWLLIDASSESAGNGIAIVSSRIADKFGMIGTAHQTVFLDKRQPAQVQKQFIRLK